MKLTPVDQIPKMNGYHKLQELIEEFTNGDATMAVALASIPEVRNAASTKLEQLKWKLKSRSKG